MEEREDKVERKEGQGGMAVKCVRKSKEDIFKNLVVRTGKETKFRDGDSTFSFVDNAYMKKGINLIIYKAYDEYVREIASRDGINLEFFNWVIKESIPYIRRLFIAIVCFYKYGYNRSPLSLRYYYKGVHPLGVKVLNALLPASAEPEINRKDYADVYNVIFSFNYQDSQIINVDRDHDIYFVIDDKDRYRVDSRYCLPLTQDKTICMVSRWDKLCRSIIRYVVDIPRYFDDEAFEDVDDIGNGTLNCFCTECTCLPSIVSHDFEFMVEVAARGSDYEQFLDEYFEVHSGEDPCSQCEEGGEENNECIIAGCFGKCDSDENHPVMSQTLYRHMCCIGNHIKANDDKKLYDFVLAAVASFVRRSVTDKEFEEEWRRRAYKIYSIKEKKVNKRLKKTSLILVHKT